jgi:hypothetical protein
MSSEQGESRPALRRYIRESDGSVEYETHDEEERKLRFSAAISHAGLVKLLQNMGGSFKFEATEETLDDLFHHEVGIKFREGVAELVVIRKPE